MRSLPVVSAGSGVAVLPMADSSAECLFRLMLIDGGRDSVAMLARRMEADPPLVVWTACQAWQADRLHPTSLAQLADWLTKRKLDVLQWADGYVKAEERLPASIAETSERLTADFQTAEIAAFLSAGDQASRDRAFLEGLLHAAEAWLRLTAVSPSDPPLELLPQWLVVHPGRLGSEAAAIVLGRMPAAAGLDLGQVRCRAEEQSRRWFQAGSTLLDLLPELATKMSRMAELDREFHQALETEKLQAMAEFAAGAGHEINNPLAIIGGHAQLLMAEETDPERRRELAVVNAQVKRAHEMIADMRLFAKPPQPERVWFDVAAMADELVAEFAAQAAERRIAVSRTGDSGPVPIEADPAQLAVALRAMCKNSLEWIAYDGHISLDLRAADDGVEIQVSDDGPGMAPEHRRHLFDPFYSGRQAGRGLGLGLSKCWRIVTAHGGRIDVESRPGQGTVFKIALPRR